MYNTFAQQLTDEEFELVAEDVVSTTLTISRSLEVRKKLLADRNYYKQELEKLLKENDRQRA